MSLLPWLSGFSLWLAVALGLVTLLWLRQGKRRLLPPGPFNLPWLGYLLWIDKEAPYETFAKLSRQYGRIYGLRLGSLYSVFLSDPDLIRQAFSREVFSGRAPLYLTHGIMKGQGLICAEGDAWREHRRFAMGVMKQLGMSGRQGSSVMESRIMDRALEFVHGLKESAARSAGGVDLVPGLRHCIGNMVNGVVFGRTYAIDDPTWIWLQHLLDEGIKLVAVAGPINFLPVLRFLPQFRNIMPFILKGQKETHEHYQEIIDEHARNLGDNQEYVNVIEAYLLEMRRRQERDGGGNRDTFTMSQLHHVLADLFGAGTDTALTTIKWIVLYAMLYPDVQERMHEEIDRVIGDGRTPCYATDAKRMPYTDAVSCEVQRIRSILPLGVPHGTLDDCELDGYQIPKGTMIVPLIGAMNQDPKLWPEPEVFRPERFLVKDEVTGEIACKRPDHFMPFQCGRRICIGEDMGRAVIFLFTVTLLQHFRLSFPDGYAYDFANMRPEYGFTLVPHPYPAVLTPKA